MSERALLITGADGYLGRSLAARRLAAGARLFLWVHASGPEALERKRARLAAELGDERLRVFGGELADDDPFAGVPKEEVGEVLHCAAVTRFNVDAETARRVNEEGARKAAAFAAACPGLLRFGLLSSVYASGLSRGRVEEARIDREPSFANHYERSKWAGERAVLTFADLPWRVFRVGTVIADDETGRVTQQNAVHNTLKLLYYGLLSIVPGVKDTPLYFVTGAFAAAAIDELMRRGEDRAVYHVAHRREESPTLGQVLEEAYQAFSESDEFRLRRVLRPLLADEESFRMLTRSVEGFGGAVINQAVASVSPFASQLFVEKEVENRRLASSLAEYRAPDPIALVRKTCEHLAATGWGRRAG